MSETVGIQQISRDRGHFVDQPRFHIDADGFLMAIPTFLLEQVQLSNCITLAPFSQRVKELVGRLTAEGFTGGAD